MSASTPTQRPRAVLLLGIVGSTAYGLAGPDSDVDRLGTFAAPVTQLTGLRSLKQSVVSTHPDVTFHEAGKLAALLLKANPTVTELLWLPSDSYEECAPLGAQLISIRSSFLSRQYVKNAYLGYASQQFRQLKARGDGSFSSDTRKRTAKHARHLARLLLQGTALYAEAQLTVRLSDPQACADFGERVAAGDVAVAEQALARAEVAFSSARSPLPEQPDTAAVSEWLRNVRAEHCDLHTA